LVGERGPELLNMRGGEQVISNSDLVSSMVNGLSMARMSGGNSTRNTYNSNSSNQSFAGAQFNLPGIQNPKEFMRWMQNEANAMGSSILR
jgi:phage-related tail protein